MNQNVKGFLLVVGCWLLVVGCWLLVVDCWLLVVDCWLLVVYYIVIVRIGSGWDNGLAADELAILFLDSDRFQEEETGFLLGIPPITVIFTTETRFLSPHQGPRNRVSYLDPRDTRDILKRNPVSDRPTVKNNVI